MPPVESPVPRAARRYLAGAACSSLGMGLTLPFLMVYLHDVRGIPTPTVGLVLGWMALASLLLAGPTGIVVDRYGPGPVLVGGLLVTAVGTGLYAAVAHTWQAFAVATVMALGGSGVHGPGNAMVAVLVPAQIRQRVYAIQFTLINLGIGLGGLVAAAMVDPARPATFEALYVLSALTVLARVAIQLTLRGVGGPAARSHGADGDADPESRAGYRELLADRVFLRLLVLGLVAITCGYAQFEAGYTAFATQQAGISPNALALAFAANTAVIVIAQMLIVRRLQGRSRSRAMALVGLIWAVSWLLTGAAGLTSGAAAAIALLVLSTVVFAVGETLWAPVMPALVNDLAPPEIRGRYNAAHAVTWSVALIIGPVIAGALIGTGLAAVWIGVIAAGCVAASAMALRLYPHLSPAQDGRPDAAEHSRAKVGVAGVAVGR